MVRYWLGSVLLATVCLGAFLAVAYPVLYPDMAPLHRHRALERVVMGQKNGYVNKHNLLRITWFSTGTPLRADVLIVRDDGRVWGERELYAYAVQGGRSGQKLSRAEQGQLVRAIAALPPQDTESVPFQDWLLVGFREGNAWRNYEFDRTRSPEALSHLFRIVQPYYSPLNTTPPWTPGYRFG